MSTAFHDNDTKFTPKVQFLECFSFPFIKQLTEKTNVEKFLGGRLGYPKEVLFFWLLVKKITNWDFRTIASMAGMSHPTLIRANQLFILKGIYQKLFVYLVRTAYKQGFIKGKFGCSYMAINQLW